MRTFCNMLTALGALALNCLLFGDVLGVMVTVGQSDCGEDVDGDE